MVKSIMLDEIHTKLLHLQTDFPSPLPNHSVSLARVSTLLHCLLYVVERIRLTSTCEVID